MHYARHLFIISVSHNSECQCVQSEIVQEILKAGQKGTDREGREYLQRYLSLAHSEDGDIEREARWGLSTVTMVTMVWCSDPDTQVLSVSPGQISLMLLRRVRLVIMTSLPLSPHNRFRLRICPSEQKHFWGSRTWKLQIGSCSCLVFQLISAVSDLELTWALLARLYEVNILFAGEPPVTAEMDHNLLCYGWHVTDI